MPTLILGSLLENIVDLRQTFEYFLSFQITVSQLD
jgi:hypothetical protein